MYEYYISDLIEEQAENSRILDETEMEELAAEREFMDMVEYYRQEGKL